MRKDAVWADHVQNLKLSCYFGCPVYLVRYDDVDIQFNSTGELIPGEAYRLKPQSSISIDSPIEPIMLFFIPEVHYEVILVEKPIDHTPIESRLIQINSFV